jgi:hypothetical protein
MTLPPDQRVACPVCGKEAAYRCKCPRGDSVCPEGHEWHRCLAHEKIVLGLSDHARPHFECSCPDAGDPMK